ncbi:FitA-like ribbon-helix-helix domain-containing protein [Cellulomonas hominis]
MSTLQIRNVPDELQRTLKARAAAAGQSLSEYALGELAAVAARPTLAELTARIRLRGEAEPATRADVVLEGTRRYDDPGTESAPADGSRA